MEKTDLNFIGLHTWKTFTPCAEHGGTASSLLPNLRQYSGSKHWERSGGTQTLNRRRFSKGLN